MARVGDPESLKLVGGAESRDSLWAGQQLQIILNDSWFSEWFTEDIKTIEAGDLREGFDMSMVRAWARKDSASNVSRLTKNLYTKNHHHHIGIEPLLDAELEWDMSRGMQFAQSVAVEIFARAGGDAIDEHVIKFLMPGIGLSGARDVLGMLRNRDLVLREDHPHVDIWRVNFN